MKILKVVENPFRKYAVKNMPSDSVYTQQTVNGDGLYYSKLKNAYYVILGGTNI